MVGSEQDIAEQQLGNCVVAASDDAGDVVVKFVLEFGVKLHQFFNDPVGIFLIPRQVLNDPLYGDLLPPGLLLPVAIMQQHHVTFLASLRQELLLGLGLKPQSLNALVHLPRRFVVILYFVDDSQQLFQGLPVSYLDGCDDQVGLVLEAEVLVDVAKDVGVLLDADLALEDLAL